ncbi:MAG TPA: flavin reductase family protein [Sphingomonas sp.]|nr:flavin reductase family protein [Sphingomonas sp.]
MVARAVATIDPASFRKVLGAYPTGVCVITSVKDGVRFGLAVGSFTSISLDPPLVGFFPGKSSNSWRSIADSGRFCVNILSADQIDICRRFASRSDDKFADLSHGVSPAGLPLIDDAVAWIDCRVETVFDIGDHFLVVGAVDELRCREEASPLIFLRGDYHNATSLQQTEDVRG